MKVLCSTIEYTMQHQLVSQQCNNIAMQQHTIQQHTMQRDTIQFRYNAVQRDGSGWQSGGPGAVGGQACDAIRGHRTASLLYFVFVSNSKKNPAKKQCHKKARPQFLDGWMDLPDMDMDGYGYCTFALGALVAC